MNTDELARTTFVLQRETHEQLSRVARRMGVSRSVLVRDVLAEPIALMAKWVDSLPPAEVGLSEADGQAVAETIQLDLVEFMERHAAELAALGEGIDRSKGKNS